MRPVLQRVLMAYRPLYLHGLLLDGQYKLPRTDPPEGPVPASSSRRRRQRTLLAALAHVFHHHRSGG